MRARKPRWGYWHGLCQSPPQHHCCGQQTHGAMKAMKASWVHELVGRARQLARGTSCGQVRPARHRRPVRQTRKCGSAPHCSTSASRGSPVGLLAIPVRKSQRTPYGEIQSQHSSTCAECWDLSAGWLRQGVWPQAVPQFAAANRGFFKPCKTRRPNYGYDRSNAR